MDKLNRPLVTVVMPIYNRRELFPIALKSIANQTYNNIEIVLVNDGSSDGTDDIIPTIKQKYPELVYIKQENKGVSSGRNTGIKNSNGDYIAFLDSDDTFAPEKIAEQLKIMTDNNADFCVSNLVKVYKNKRELYSKICDIFFIASPDHIISKVIPVSGSTIIFKNNKDNKHLFDENFKTSEDSDFLLRAMATGKKVVFLNKPLVFNSRDFGGNRLSVNFTNQISGIKSRIERIECGEYKLNDKQKNNYLKNSFYEVAFFCFLNNNGADSAKYFKKYLNLEDKIIKKIKAELFLFILFFKLIYNFILFLFERLYLKRKK